MWGVGQPAGTPRLLVFCMEWGRFRMAPSVLPQLRPGWRARVPFYDRLWG